MGNEIIFALIGLAAGAVIIYLFLPKKTGGADPGSLLMLQNQMNELIRSMDAKLGEGNNRMFESIRTQFGESQRLAADIRDLVAKQLSEVAKEQTKTNEATYRFMTIAEQLANLEKVLKHQKQRGNLGEASLELILSNILPPGAYKMQYRFGNNDAVDPVIMTKEGVNPVAAKFSLDNYNRVLHAIDDKQREELEKEFKNDLKKRIDETSKYIRTEEGTLPFAFMFIPAEAIYYVLLINEVGSVKINTRNLIDYAYNEKKVIIVSPTTF